VTRPPTPLITLVLAYQNLTFGKGRGDSLRLVQLDMLARNPRLHPFYWANFIQSGDWAPLDSSSR
jgi:hypothetical protein